MPPSKLAVASTSRPTLADFGLLEARLQQVAEPYEKPRNLAFAKMILVDVFGVPENEADEYIVDGGNDRGVDIVYIDHANRTINICSCKTVTSFRKAHSNFPSDEIDKLSSLIHDVLYKREDRLADANPALALYIRSIWEIIALDPYQIDVHLFSNQAKLVSNERDRFLAYLTQNRIRLFEHGLYELAHGVVRATKPTFKKRLKPKKTEVLQFDEGHGRCVHLCTKLADFVEFVSESERQFDERLLAQNVRYYLGLNNEVNAAIRETLISGNADKFPYLNNGITVVCDQIIGLPNGHHDLTVINPKIVNGGQTANVIFECGAKLLKLNEGIVSIKLIETTSEEFIEEIAIAANSQSRIFGRDLRAFDSFQEKLARAIAAKGFAYRRKRGEALETPPEKIIDMARAGQLLLAYVHGEPTLSKTNSNDIFGDLYSKAFDATSVHADLILTAFLIHRDIEKLRQLAIAEQKAATRHSFSEAWIIEGHLHVLFVVGELIRRQGGNLADYALGASLTGQGIEIVARFVAANPKVASYRLFRLVTSKATLLNMLDSASIDRSVFPIQLNLDI